MPRTTTPAGRLPPYPSYPSYPPPNEDLRDPNRRSPVSLQSNTPPNMAYQQYVRGDYETSTTSHRNSPGATSNSSTAPAVMSVGNLVDVDSQARSQADSTSRENIDQDMLGRLNRRTQQQ